MEITFTDQAKKQLANQVKAKSEYLCLAYEVGGCGSQLDGIIQMHLSVAIPNDYVLISTNWIPVYMENFSISLLEERLTIDYKSNRYMIKSDSQIYNVYKD